LVSAFFDPSQELHFYRIKEQYCEVYLMFCVCVSGFIGWSVWPWQASPECW